MDSSESGRRSSENGRSADPATLIHHSMLRSATDFVSSQDMASRHQIDVGGVKIGGGAPVAVQTMTKTETANLGPTMEQIRTAAEAGADIVRVAVPRDQDVEALKTIVRESPVPIIAD